MLCYRCHIKQHNVLVDSGKVVYPYCQECYDILKEENEKEKS